MGRVGQSTPSVHDRAPPQVAAANPEAGGGKARQGKAAHHQPLLIRGCAPSHLMRAQRRGRLGRRLRRALAGRVPPKQLPRRWREASKDGADARRKGSVTAGPAAPARHHGAVNVLHSWQRTYDRKATRPGQKLAGQGMQARGRSSSCGGGDEGGGRKCVVCIARTWAP